MSRFKVDYLTSPLIWGQQESIGKTMFPGAGEVTMREKTFFETQYVGLEIKDEHTGEENS